MLKRHLPVCMKISHKEVKEEDDLFVASNDTLGVQYSFHTQNGLSFIADTASMELI